MLGVGGGMTEEELILEKGKVEGGSGRRGGRGYQSECNVFFSITLKN